MCSTYFQNVSTSIFHSKFSLKTIEIFRFKKYVVVNSKYYVLLKFVISTNNIKLKNYKSIPSFYIVTVTFHALPYIP